VTARLRKTIHALRIYLNFMIPKSGLGPAP
jgi:hypothetical protein